MRTHFFRLVVFIGASACSGAPVDVEPSCENGPIQGAAGLMTRENSRFDSVEVGPIETCGEEGAYIRLTGSGWRTIVMGHGEIEGLAGCSVEAALRGPKGGCPKIQLGLFGATLGQRLEMRGVNTIGLGLGVCGDMNGDYEAWRPSIALVDWAEVDTTIEEAAKLMSELEIGNTFGVTVRPIPCVIPL